MEYRREEDKIKITAYKIILNIYNIYFLVLVDHLVVCALLHDKFFFLACLSLKTLTLITVQKNTKNYSQI